SYPLVFACLSARFASKLAVVLAIEAALRKNNSPFAPITPCGIKAYQKARDAAEECHNGGRRKKEGPIADYRREAEWATLRALRPDRPPRRKQLRSSSQNIRNFRHCPAFPL